MANPISASMVLEQKLIRDVNVGGTLCCNIATWIKVNRPDPPGFVDTVQRLALRFDYFGRVQLYGSGLHCDHVQNPH